jgi:hypothetical protein
VSQAVAAAPVVVAAGVQATVSLHMNQTGAQENCTLLFEGASLHQKEWSPLGWWLVMDSDRQVRVQCAEANIDKQWPLKSDDDKTDEDVAFCASK